MQQRNKILAMSTVLAAGVILGMTISAGYAAESSETIPAEVIRTGFRLQICLALFVAVAVALLLCHEPATPRRLRVEAIHGE